MHELVHHINRRLRVLYTRPSFSLTIVGMLALGIASNIAVFTVFNSLYLRPLPFPESDRLIDLDETAPKWNLQRVGVSNPDLSQWRSSNSTFESMAFFRGPSCNFSDSGVTQRIQIAQVTREMLEVLHLRPVIGRNFSADEDKPGGAKVLLLNDGLWQRMYHSNVNVLGRALKLDDEPYTVVGVLPRGAVFPDRAELWVPLAADPNVSSGYYVNGVGRLKPGVSLEQAGADLLRIHKAMISAGHTVNEITSPKLTPLRERYLGDFKTVGRALMAAVAMVLLIGCVNIAALILVRGFSRARELAIRAALGASPRRIAAQLFAENVVLAAAGGLCGVLIGETLLRAGVPMLSDKLPQWVSFSMDWRFVLFSITTTATAALLFGLAPSLQAARVDIRGSLQDVAVRTTPPKRQRTTLAVLAVCEIGVALVLCISAGLLTQAFRKVLSVDPGFRAENVLTFRLRLPDKNYGSSSEKIAYYDRLLERMRTLPGVKAVGASSAPPLGGQWGGVFEAEGGRAFNTQHDNPTVLQIAATPGYFPAMGMRLLDGRAFEEQDGKPKPRLVAMVNETFVKHFWGGGSPVGSHIRRIGAQDWLEVVGLLRDEKHYGLDQDVLPSVFLPYATALFTGLRGDERALQEMSIVLRSPTDLKVFIDPSREIARQLDPDVPMYAIETMAEKLDESLWERRAYSWLFGAFAVIAVLLGAAGIWGTISYGVSQRTQEIGIRMALGARPGQVLGEVLMGALMVVSIGVALGLVGALCTTSFLQSLLFGVNSRDPLVFAAVVLCVMGVAFFASLIPASRAAKVDPMVALRYE
jgi:predicted permease